MISASDLCCRSRLENQRIRVFLDVEVDYWGPFPDELRSRIAHTPYFIALLTKGCLESHWVAEEIKQALATHRRIIVVRESSFESPSPEGMSAELQGFLMLNQVPYLHEFTDEVMSRVISQIERRKFLVPKRWFAVASMMVFGIVGARSLTAQHLTWSDSVTSQSRPPTVITSTTISSVKGDAPADAGTEAFSGQMPKASAPIVVDDTVQKRTNVAVVPSGHPVSPGRQLRAREPMQRSFRFRLFGYDPTLGADRKGCREAITARACERDRLSTLAKGSIWTEAAQCEPCSCPH